MLHRIRLPVLSTLVVAGLAIFMTLAPGPSAKADTDTPVVLELFTSQGCSSCPEADRVLADIAAMREDIVALSLHVNYWDYMGWEDRFATAEITRRQHQYNDTLGLTYVYTPQLVINGRRHVVGSGREEIMALIADAKAEIEAGLPIDIAPGTEGGVHVSIGSGTPPGNGNADNVVWMVSYDREHSTQVTAGENAGNEMVNHRVVRSFRQIAVWRGGQLEIPISAAELRADGGDGCAILVQADNGIGPILGARQIWLDQGLF